MEGTHIIKADNFFKYILSKYIRSAIVGTLSTFAAFVIT